MWEHLRRYLWLACLVATSLCLDPLGFGLGFCLLPLPEIVMVGGWDMLRQNGGVVSGSECDLSGLTLLTGGLRWIDTAGTRPDRMCCWWQVTGLLRVASGWLIDSVVWRGPLGDPDVHGWQHRVLTAVKSSPGTRSERATTNWKRLGHCMEPPSRSAREKGPKLSPMGSYGRCSIWSFVFFRGPWTASKPRIINCWIKKEKFTKPLIRKGLMHFGRRTIEASTWTRCWDGRVGVTFVEKQSVAIAWLGKYRLWDYWSTGVKIAFSLTWRASHVV